MQWLIIVVILAIFNTPALAEGPSAWLGLNYNSSEESEEGEKTEAFNSFSQNFYFNFDKSVTPFISYHLYLRELSDDSHTDDLKGNITSAYQRALEPALEITFQHPVYNFSIGYRRLERWSTAHLKNESRNTTDFYYSRFDIRPKDLPYLSLQFDRESNYDHLSEKKIDSTTTAYSANSSYALSYKDIKLSYDLSFSRDENKTPLSDVTKTISNNFNGNYNLSYYKSFWRDSVNVSASYLGNYSESRTEQYAAQTGNVPFERSPSLGMHGLGTQLEPKVDKLTSANTLSDNIYDVPATTSTGTINIGQNGGKFHNTGIQLFSSQKAVDTLYVYVKKDVSSDINLINKNNWEVYRSDFNLPVTWTEITIQTVTVNVFDSLNDIYRYEIKFSSAQKALYFRAINMDVASVNDVFVTEIEAYGTDIIPSSGKITETSTFFTQGMSFSVGVKPMDRLSFSLNYSLNRADQNPKSVLDSIKGIFSNISSKSFTGQDDELKSNVTRTYGAGSTWLAHRLLTASVSFQRSEAFDNKNETDLRSDSYSLTLNSSPLPTLDTNFTLGRNYTFSFGEKEAMNDIYLLTIGAKLFKDVNMITDVGYTQSTTYATDSEPSATDEDTKSSSQYFRGLISAVLTPNISANISYGFTLSKTSGEDSSTLNDGMFIVTYRPGRFVNLSGTFTVSDRDGEIDTSEGLLVDWLLLPAVRMSLNYQHTSHGETSLTTDSINGYVSWYITKFMSMQLSYSYNQNAAEIKTESHSFTGNLTCRFW